MIFCVLVMSVGQAWGDDYTETYSNPTGTNPPARANGMGAFTTITPDGTNVTFGNSSLQIGTASASGTFTISSTDGSYITGITFTQNGSYPVGTLTSSDGTVTGLSTNVYTFTPSTSTKTSCSFSMTASASKTRIPTIVVSLSSNYEYFSKNFSISSGTVSCTKSNAKTDVTITSTGGTSSNGLTLASGNALTIASSGHNIKAVHFTCESHNTMSNLSANTGTYSSNGWTKSTATNTVTFTSSGSNATIVGISVELEAGCTSISPSLSYTSTSLMVGDDSSSPTLTGNTGSGTVTWTSSDEEVATVNESTGVVTAVAAGTATITASIAANGGYCEGSATANFTINRDPVGEDHVLTWPLTTVSGSSENNVDGGTTDIGTGTAKSTSSYITNQTDLTGVGVKRTTTGKNSNTGKIETPTSYDAAKYVSFTFDVEDGYQFTPTEVSIKTVAVATAKDLKFEFSDANGSYSVTKANLSTNSSAATNVLDFSECDVDFTGTVTVKIYVYGATDAYRLSTPLTITGDVAAVAAATCTDKYSFHYGPAVGDWETPICFEQVDDTHEWQITNFTVPDHTNGELYVGYQGYSYNSDLGTNHSESRTVRWTATPTQYDGKWQGQIALAPNDGGLADYTVGQPAGATGTLSIYDNTADFNLYVTFKPDGYGITYGGTGYAFKSTATDHMMETDVVTLPTVSTTYNIGLKTATDGTYVKCAHSKTTDEAISAMGVTIKNGGKKMIYLVPGSFNSAGAVYAVWDCSYNSGAGQWGDGTTKLFTDVDEDGIYECPVDANCANIILVRLSSGTDASNISWERKWNQTSGSSTISVGDLLQKYEITSLDGDNCSYSTTAMHPASSEKGKFRMWDNSDAQNWYVHWIPYNVLSYDGNGGTGSTTQAERNTESSTTTVTVASNGFTAPTGYSFNGWNTLAGGGGDSYAAGADYTLTANATLYAQWANNQYSVTHSGSNRGVTSGTTGANAATYGTDYTAKFSETTGYNLPATITVTIGGNTTTQGTEYTWNQGTGTVVVVGDYILGDVVITVNGVLKTYTVNFASNNVSYGTVSSSSISSVPHGSTVSINGSTNALTLNGSTITVLPTTSTAAYTYAFDHWSVDNGDEITGTTTITATFTRTAKTYNVDVTLTDSKATKKSGTTGSNAATFGTNHTLEFEAVSGYELPNDVTVIIGSDEATKGVEYTWSVSEGVGTLQIGGLYILGNIAITVTATSTCSTPADPDGLAAGSISSS
ncbi:MAG: InlB B-repeat-containing protein, partial [Paludibacteraceae bacterium]|nr:InlB B-repeat-containing protein [Paludibacteraceae bacterium]